MSSFNSGVIDTKLTPLTVMTANLSYPSNGLKAVRGVTFLPSIENARLL